MTFSTLNFFFTVILVDLECACCILNQYCTNRKLEQASCGFWPSLMMITMMMMMMMMGWWAWLVTRLWPALPVSSQWLRSEKVQLQFIQDLCCHWDIPGYVFVSIFVLDGGILFNWRSKIRKYFMKQNVNWT